MSTHTCICGHPESLHYRDWQAENEQRVCVGLGDGDWCPCERFVAPAPSPRPAEES